MPATYTVTSGRNQRMSFDGTDDAISVTWHQDYFVEVTGVDPATVDAVDVLSATGIPVVNRSIYTIQGKIIPYVLCRNKSAEQDARRLARWKVKTKWTSSIKSNSEESDNTPITPPAALSDIAPRVVPFLGETEKVLYMDKSSTPVDASRTPAGNWWSEPIIERIPTLTLKITQYEQSISEFQMLERKFKVNEQSYRSQPPFDWMIMDVEPTEVDITLSGGITTAALVTYTVEHSPNLYGWKAERALFDTQYIESSVVKLFQNDQPGTSSIGYITSSGAKRGTQSGAPDYLQYEQQERIDFDTFLQV